MEKKLATKTNADLLQARTEGLTEISKRTNMQAHGKLLGMDTFSWCDPHFESLVTDIQSFPFPVIWICKHEQYRCALTYYPELTDQIQSLLIYDQGNLKFKHIETVNLPDLIAFDGLDNLLQVLPNLISQKCVLLFTSEAINQNQDLNTFIRFISH